MRNYSRFNFSIQSALYESYFFNSIKIYFSFTLFFQISFAIFYYIFYTQTRDQIFFNMLRQVEIQLKCHCITSLASKQIQTECLFDVSQPFFRRIKSTIGKNFSLFTFALFESSNTLTRTRYVLFFLLFCAQ